MNVSESDGSITFSVRVVPRASRSEIVGEHAGALRVRISSAPVDGVANAELIRVFAKHFGLARGDVSILTGETSRNKRIKIANVSVSKFRELIK